MILLLLLGVAKADEPEQVEVDGVVSDCTAKSATSEYEAMGPSQLLSQGLGN